MEARPSWDPLFFTSTRDAEKDTLMKGGSKGSCASERVVLLCKLQGCTKGLQCTRGDAG